MVPLYTDRITPVRISQFLILCRIHLLAQDVTIEHFEIIRPVPAQHPFSLPHPHG